MTVSKSAQCHAYQNVTNEVMRWKITFFSRYAGVIGLCCLVTTENYFSQSVNSWGGGEGGGFDEISYNLHLQCQCCTGYELY